MWAMLTWLLPEFTRPMNSSISFGLLPAASIRVGVEIRVGISVWLLVRTGDPDSASSYQAKEDYFLSSLSFGLSSWGKRISALTASFPLAGADVTNRNASPFFPVNSVNAVQ